MIHHFNIHVKGIVQGVFFRASAKAKADELGVTGIVRNEPDGSVYIEAEGASEPLQKLVSWCQHGPPFAKVEKCDVTEAEVRNYRTFAISR